MSDKSVTHEQFRLVCAERDALLKYSVRVEAVIKELIDGLICIKIKRIMNCGCHQIAIDVLEKTNYGKGVK